MLAKVVSASTIITERVKYLDNAIVCLYSALTLHGLFSGWVPCNRAWIYSREPVKDDFFTVYCRDDLDFVATTFVGGVKCTTVDQTFNDMLRYYDEVDDSPLIEALNSYYFLSGQTFKNLKIETQYNELFEELQADVVQYTAY